MSYMASNSAGDFHSDLPSTSAVSWGVFPGKEVIQPLVSSPESFKAWTSEALALWTSEWGAVVADAEPASYQLLKDIQDTWFLVSLIENDYVNGDLFRITA